MVEGKLFYVIGASGSGKDSLMRYARERLAGDSSIVFAHRYITRPVELHGENHVALTEAEFEARFVAGLFAMDWESHGLRYGIGREINFWLSKGCNVVMNGSREYLAEAINRYPAIIPILIVVSPEVLASRLRNRGRENDEQIAHRLQRARLFSSPNEPVLVIHNDKPLPDVGAQFIHLISDNIPLAAAANMKCN